MDLVIEERGQGPDVLWLVHGLGASRDHFVEVADLLSSDFRCMLPDLRGHGDSPGGPVPDLTIFASDLLSYVKAMPGALVGMSMGAVVVLDLWHAAPDVPAVVLVDPMLDPGALWAWARAGAPDDRAAYRRVIATYLERDFDRLVELEGEHPLTRDLPDTGKRRNARSMLAASEGTLHEALRCMRRESQPGRWQRPAAARGQACIMRAAQSPVCPPVVAEATAQALGGYVRAIDSSHCVALHQPQLLADALRQELIKPGSGRNGC